MKRTIFSVLLIGLFGLSSCNLNLRVPNKANKIYHVAEVLPEYPGGTKAMVDFIKENLPSHMLSTATRRRVVIRFVVNKSGRLSHFEPILTHNRKREKKLEKEVIKVLKKMPRWNPAIHESKKVRCYMTIPFTF